jgi:hypothetical protein
MPSYVTHYASAGRDSRVATPRRPLRELTRLAVHPAPLEGYAAPLPQFVLVAPDGRHAICDHGVTVRIYGGDGARLHDTFIGAWRHAYLATDAGYFNGPTLRPWTTAPNALGVPPFIDRDAILWVLAEHDGRLLAAMHHQQSRERSLEMLVVAGGLAPPLARFLWDHRTPDLCVAAISPKGVVAVASQTGALRLLAPEGAAAPKGNPDAFYPHLPKLLFDGHHGAGAAYELSFVAGDVCLLSHMPPGAALDSATLAERTRIHDMPWAAPGRWRSWLHRHGPDGAERLVLELPFTVRQPAIDGGGGRVLVAGDGLAALDGDEIVWQRESALPGFATAYGDGSVAFAAGRELVILDRDGREIERHELPEDELVFTPPAIGADGSVWLATGKALYRASSS